MVSFIVPAHNEEAWIGRSLSAIAEVMKSFALAHEVIVVDDASTDATATIGKNAGARIIRVSHRQIAAARNAGARNARGDILFFVDADTLVNAGIIQSALQVLSEGAVAGGCVPKFEGELPLWFRAIYPLMIFAMRSILHQTGGACLFCTRAAFMASGGFSEEHYAAEEDVWVKAVKKHGRFIVLAEPVITSGRSLRTQSVWTIGLLFLRLALQGSDAFRDRRGSVLWYRPTQGDFPKDVRQKK